MRVLVVEDDPTISHFVVKGLIEERYVVDLVEDGLAAEERAAHNQYDVILLDVMLPGLNGFDVCRQLRMNEVDTPILMVTAREMVRDRITGLDAGADDYLVKPFAFDELLARLRALTRRGRTRQFDVDIRYGPIAIDPRDHSVRVNGARLELTATEYRLLEHLTRRAESIVSRDQIAEHVWGTDHDPGSNIVEVYIGYIRKKLQAHWPEPLIQTIRGLGYMLKQRTS